MLLYDPRRLERPVGRLSCSLTGQPVTSLAWQSDRSRKAHSASRPASSQSAGTRASLAAGGTRDASGSLSPIQGSPSASPRVSPGAGGLWLAASMLGQCAHPTRALMVAAAAKASAPSAQGARGPTLCASCGLTCLGATDWRGGGRTAAGGPGQAAPAPLRQL